MTATQSLIDAILAEDTRIHRVIGKEITDAKKQLSARAGDTNGLPALIDALERVGRQFDPSTPAARLRAQRAALTMLNNNKEAS